MIRIIVHYYTPEDPAAFDAHYAATHIPLTRAMPLLKGFEISKGEVSTSDPDKPVYLTAILSYDSAADMAASLDSEAGKAAVADVANFATGGVTLITTETEELM
ncbi:MAG: ethD like-protein [Rhodobacteraceae bacterium]|nr:ethD like-protein [Paracoccaceae bacterium]MAY45387.1 ethD like-protein [Paracoccaceae bacterium]